MKNGVGFLVLHQTNLSTEEKAAWNFLRRLKGRDVRTIPFSSLKKAPSTELPSVLWWHYDSSTVVPQETLDPEVIAAVRTYVARGGSLMLSLLAAQYVADLGFESVRPNVIEKGPWQQKSWAEGYPDIRGFASFQGHPIFAGLSGGFYTWNPTLGVEYSSALFNDVVPANGKVVGIERLYIKLNEHRRIINEYTIGKGTVLSVGAYLFFRDPHQRFRAHLERFTQLCLDYLSRPNRQGATYWSFEERTVKAFTHTGSALGSCNDEWRIEPNGLLIRRELSAQDESQPYDVGGRRILVMGKERGGIDEVWCHPMRALRNARVGFHLGGAPTVWSHTLNPQVVIEPEAVTRTYHVGEATIEEVVFSSLELPAGAMHYRIDSREPVDIIITAQVDLRMMWPLNEVATGPMKFAWDERLRAAIIMNGSGELVSLIGASIQPSEHRLGQFSAINESEGRLVGEPTADIVVGVGLRYRLDSRTTQCTVAFSGSNLGEGEAIDAYRRIVRNPQRALHHQSKHFHDLLKNAVRINSPDPAFNDGFGWSLVATDRFVATTPRVGTSLLAGIGTTERGWDGGHKISGRPGYAWYFGRDAAWSSLAMLDYGDFESVRYVLEFLGDHQDLNGKILHEFTTSGFAHYDAADSTPLYMLLMGRYLRASGDTTFARGQFKRLVRAVEFCFSTDTDGDHLIENSNVGHGWVEGGGLFPVHTEHYLASLWSAALEEASIVANVVGASTATKRWKKEARTVREIVVKEFWNPQTHFYNFAKRKDGSFSEERTVLPAVGMYLGIAESAHAATCLTEYAAQRFSTDWGVRIIGNDNPMFQPTGYHYGSVWPLFTGWTSLAEFRWDRPLQGYLHVLSNLLNYKFFSGGYVEEVLHGEKFEPAGVCSHQAWSETMVLQPLIEGMLGLHVNALTDEVILRPWFPPDWQSAEVKNIRIGDRRVSLKMSRKAGSTRYECRSNGRTPLHISFQPRLLLGSTIEAITIGRKSVAFRRVLEAYGDFRPIQFRLERSSSVTVHHRAGIGVVPPTPPLKPHEHSRGVRIIDESFGNTTYLLDVDVPPDASRELWIADPEGRMRSCKGASISHRKGELLRILLPANAAGRLRIECELSS